jgi:hypothetical protein
MRSTNHGLYNTFTRSSSSSSSSSSIFILINIQKANEMAHREGAAAAGVCFRVAKKVFLSLKPMF